MKWSDHVPSVPDPSSIARILSQLSLFDRLPIIFHSETEWRGEASLAVPATRAVSSTHQRRGRPHEAQDE